MDANPVARKRRRLRVNFPLALPVEHAQLVERACEITNQSRNAFCVAAAVARAEAVVASPEHQRSAERINRIADEAARKLAG